MSRDNNYVRCDRARTMPRILVAMKGASLLLFLYVCSDAFPAVPPEGQRQEVSEGFLCIGPELALSTQQLSSPDRREVVGSAEAL